MKYQNLIDQIINGAFSRDELKIVEANAKRSSAVGKLGSEDILDALKRGKAKETYILFMGFCPGAKIENRLDTYWKEKEICRFDFLLSKSQLVRFENVYVDDLIILKKREKFGKTMKLYGHGRVKSIMYDQNGIRYFNMKWSKQHDIIEVPLLGANSTVDIRSMKRIQDEMPEEFFSWVKE